MAQVVSERVGSRLRFPIPTTDNNFFVSVVSVGYCQVKRCESHLRVSKCLDNSSQDNLSRTIRRGQLVAKYDINVTGDL